MDMRTTAEFRGEITDLHYSDAISILVAEKSESPLTDGILITRLFDGNVSILTHTLVHRRFNRLQFLFGDRARVMEIEPQTVGCDQRTCLAHVGSQLLAQDRVQNMRRGMVQHGSLAVSAIDCKAYFIADLEASFFDPAFMDRQLGSGMLCIHHFK